MAQATKKILILAGIYPPDIGGPAIYSERLAKELQAPVISYSRVLKRFPRGLRHLLYFLAVLKLARKYDIFYAQTIFSAGIPGLMAAKLLRKKLVIKITGDHAWERFNKGESMEEFQNKKYGWRVRFIKKMQTCLLKKATKIIAPSQYLKRIIVGWGVPSQKIEVIYNAAITLPDLTVSRTEIQKKIGIEGDVILSVGRLMFWKGFDTLIEIMPDLLKENPNFSLVIVGDGPEEKNLKNKIANLNLNNKVKLTGRVSHAQIPLYFKVADLFVLNTGYEGLSHVILEVMQSGIPVITTNIGGNPELIENGENGILIDYKNKEQLKEAILKLAKDKSLKEKFRQNSKEKLKAFTWQNVINQTLKTFNSL